MVYKKHAVKWRLFSNIFDQSVQWENFSGPFSVQFSRFLMQNAVFKGKTFKMSWQGQISELNKEFFSRRNKFMQYTNWKIQFFKLRKSVGPFWLSVNVRSGTKNFFNQLFLNLKKLDREVYQKFFIHCI